MTDLELIESYEEMDIYDPEMCEEIVKRADKYQDGILDEYTAADGETFEDMLEIAINVLKEHM